MAAAGDGLSGCLPRSRWADGLFLGARLRSPCPRVADPARLGRLFGLLTSRDLAIVRTPELVPRPEPRRLPFRGHNLARAPQGRLPREHAGRGADDDVAQRGLGEAAAARRVRHRRGQVSGGAPGGSSRLACRAASIFSADDVRRGGGRPDEDGFDRAATAETAWKLSLLSN